jgi:hypothetical protein
VASLANSRCGSVRTDLHGLPYLIESLLTGACATIGSSGHPKRRSGSPTVPVDQTVRSRGVIHFERMFLSPEDRYAESGKAQAQKAPFDCTTYAWQLWRRLTVPSLIPFPFLIQQVRWRRSDAQRFPNQLLELPSLPGMPFPISLGISAVTLLIEALSRNPRKTMENMVYT